MREKSWPERILTYLIAPIVIGALVGLLGAWGTGADMSMPARFLYWIAILLGGWLQVALLALILVRLLPGPALIGFLLAGLVAAVPVAYEIVLLDGLMRATPRVADFGDIVVHVGAGTLALACVLAALALWHDEDGENEDDDAVEAPPEIPFLRRVPQALGDHLVCIVVEGPHVRVHTRKGNTLVQVDIREAVKEVKGVDGVRAHRNYWVARDAVEGVDRSGSETLLLLRNGLQVPVGPNYKKTVERSGLLEPFASEDEAG